MNIFQQILFNKYLLGTYYLLGTLYLFGIHLRSQPSIKNVSLGSETHLLVIFPKVRFYILR